MTSSSPPSKITRGTVMTLLLLALLAIVMFVSAVVFTVRFVEGVSIWLGGWIDCVEGVQCLTIDVWLRSIVKLSLTLSITAVLLIVLTDVCFPGYLILFGYVLSEKEQRQQMGATLSAAARERRNSFSTFMRNVRELEEEDAKM